VYENMVECEVENPLKENLTWEMYDFCVKQLEYQINRSKKKFDAIYGLPRGGLPLAVSLSHKLNLALIVNKEYITKDTLIVDDISDRGKTLVEFNKNIIATIYTTDETLTKPNFFVFMKRFDWIVFPWEEGESYGYD